MTESLDFPTTACAFQRTSRGEDDAFAARLAPSGSSLVYSTLLGGMFDDAGEGIAVDAARNAHVTGVAAPGFPTAGAFQARTAAGSATGS